MYKYIISTLKNEGFQAYIVGGAVRDVLMGKQPKDYDVVTSAKPYEIKDIFKNDNISEVGESFKVMIICGVEVATYRKDRYFGLSDKNVEVSYADTLEEDLARRDLTMNSIAMNTNNGKLVDPFNGKSDIKLRTIKFTGDSDKRIYEDPCRILRALRFCCLFPDFYNIDKSSYNSLQKNAFLVSHIPKERLRTEILKVMGYKQPSLFFYLLKEFNILDRIFPSLDKCYYHYDGNYHKETIFMHNMITGDSINKNPLLRLAGYLHDVGKPPAFEKNNSINYRHHDAIGIEIVKKELTDLKFSNKEIEYITNLIDIHMVNLEGLGGKGIRRLFSKLNEKNISWNDLFRLRVADRAGNLGKPNYTRKEIRELIISIHKELNKKPAFSVKDLDINGHDIMDILGIPPSQKVGEILKYLFEKVLECPELNNKEQLEELVRVKGGVNAV